MSHMPALGPLDVATIDATIDAKSDDDEEISDKEMTTPKKSCMRH